MNSVVSSGVMGTVSRDLKELVGEHEAIKAYMETMVKSAENLAAQSSPAKEQIFNYRCRLYDFKDAIMFHLEIDDRVFKSLFGDSYDGDPAEEHFELQKLIDDMILLADNPIVEKLDGKALTQYCAGLKNAFEKICKLLEIHIAREDAILERVQNALNQD